MTYLEPLAPYASDILFRGFGILGFLRFGAELSSHNPVVLGGMLRLLWLLSLSRPFSDEAYHILLRSRQLPVAHSCGGHDGRLSDRPGIMR